MRRIICFVAAVATFAPALSSAQNNFPDVPDNHGRYEALNSLWWIQGNQHADILVEGGLLKWPSYDVPFNGYPELPSPMPQYRQDFEQAIRELATSLQATPEGSIVVTWRHRSWQLLLPVAEALFQDFLNGPIKITGEFRSLSESFVLIRARFAELGMPVDENRFERFTDLECGHWANLAISRMRDRGILRGYPDNTFRG